MKKKSLEESVRGHSSGIIESERRIEVVGESGLKEAISNFKKFLKTRIEVNDDGILELQRGSFEGVDYVFSNEEINRFLISTLSLEREDNYNRNLGLYVSKLIDNAYTQGFNNFNLDLRCMPPLDFILSKTSTDYENSPFIASVKGDVRHYFAHGRTNSKINFEGNAGELFCSFVYNSEIYAKGDLGWCAFTGMKSTSIVIEGKIPEVDWGTENCVFKVYEERLVKDLKEELPQREGHKIVLIDDKGVERVVAQGRWN